MKYTYEDIILDPDSEELKIGELYFFGNNPRELLEDANEGAGLSELKEVEKALIHPFVRKKAIISSTHSSMVIKYKGENNTI